MLFCIRNGCLVAIKARENRGIFELEAPKIAENSPDMTAYTIFLSGTLSAVVILLRNKEPTIIDIRKRLAPTRTLIRLKKIKLRGKDALQPQIAKENMPVYQ